MLYSGQMRVLVAPALCPQWISRLTFSLLSWVLV